MDILHPIALTSTHLQTIFPDAHSIQEMFLKVFNDDLTPKEHLSFQTILHNLLGDWQPDIVITYPTHNSLLKQAFPHALHLLMENGIFSRPPFCRSLRYDPTHFLNGFPNKFEQNIRNFKITEQQSQAVEHFKQQLRLLIHKHNPLDKQFHSLREKFKYLILCPIPTDNAYKETPFDDQYLYLLDILNKIPHDVGLIITFHDGPGVQLNEAMIHALQQNFPNLLYFPTGNNTYISQSLNFFEYCDAIINMHTMTGTQALLWDLKIISLDKRYSKWFCDKQGLENLEEFLAAPKIDKNGLIYWYMTHFTVFEKDFDTPGWYYNYFKTKLEKFKKNGITFDFYEQINDFNELSNYILGYVKHYLRHAFKRQFTLLCQRYSKRPKQIYELYKQFYRYR